MIVAIQQPEHLPWIGFFNKMAHCDLYVYLDNVQFKKRYFENRNRVKGKDGEQWLTVPVLTKGAYDQKINEVLIDNSGNWAKKYLNTFEHLMKKSPHWEEARDVVFPVVNAGHEKLVNLNVALIEACRIALRIETKTALASALDVGDYKGSEIILQISRKTGATTYYSGPDGRNYLQVADFERNAISVAYHDFEHPVYEQLYEPFASHMSVVDIIANCGGKMAGEIIRNSYRIKA